MKRNLNRKWGRKYSVSDGRLVLTLEEAVEGGFVVTSPLDPAIITEAETISEAFMMARDAMKAIAASRAKSLRSESLRRPATNLKKR